MRLKGWLPWLLAGTIVALCLPGGARAVWRNQAAVFVYRSTVRDLARADEFLRLADAWGVDPGAHFLRARWRMLGGDLAGAMVLLQETLRHDPGHVLAHADLSRLHAAAGDALIADAHQNLARAHSGVVWWAHALVRAGAVDEAVAAYSATRRVDLFAGCQELWQAAMLPGSPLQPDDLAPRCTLWTP